MLNYFEKYILLGVIDSIQFRVRKYGESDFKYHKEINDTSLTIF